MSFEADIVGISLCCYFLLANDLGDMDASIAIVKLSEILILLKLM